MIGHGFRWSLLSPVFRHVCLYVSASLTLSGRPLSRSIPPSLSLPLSLSVSLSLSPSPSLSLFVALPLFLSLLLSLSLSLSVFLSLSLYLSLSLPLFALPFYLSIYLFTHPYIYICGVYMCIYIYIYLSLSLSLPHSQIKAPLLGCQISQVRIVYVGDREGEVVSVGWCWLPKSNTNPPLQDTTSSRGLGRRARLNPVFAAASACGLRPRSNHVVGLSRPCQVPSRVPLRVNYYRDLPAWTWLLHSLHLRECTCQLPQATPSRQGCQLHLPILN